MPRNFEELGEFRLDRDVEEELLRLQTECTFVWSTRDGWPMGVIMTYLVRDGRFWLTASSQRGRVAAVRRDPRVTIVITSMGTRLGPQKSVTYRGECVVHENDEEVKRWFYPALGERRFPEDEEYRREFVAKLDSPRRVVLEVVPDERISYDGAKMHGGRT